MTPTVHTGRTRSVRLALPQAGLRQDRVEVPDGVAVGFPLLVEDYTQAGENACTDPSG